jgi:hypothetical protein
MKIGVTGHRRLPDPAAWAWVERAIEAALEPVSPPLVGVTSLAAGADQIFARVVARRGGSIHAVLPFPDYERTMVGEELSHYRDLLSLAAAVETLDIGGADEDGYLAAGERVVRLSDRIFAIWDGEPARGKGGTGDIVVYAVNLGVPVVHINPIARSVSDR